jgi:hypothetical protein
MELTTIVPMEEMREKSEQTRAKIEAERIQEKQKFLAKHRKNCIKAINVDLLKKGYSWFTLLRSAGEKGELTKEEHIAFGEQLVEEFKAQGYYSYGSAYALSNKKKDFELCVRLSD